ncbi:MAG: pyroglutamyl-peptidase I [Tissierellia bacterium]|nr:pyroglutamyl-peptidase I [Tissierellia bacterium]
MKILLSAFEPFGGEKINPALETMKGVANKINGHDILKLEIPTVFHKASTIIVEKMKEIDPDIVLSLGQAGGRSGITVEFVGINWMDARIPDNEGNQPLGEKICHDGENAYFSNIPGKAIVEELNQQDIPSKISYTAGTFVCNEVLYNTLYYIQKNKMKTKAGFIHLPYSVEQIKEKAEDRAYMKKEDMIHGIEIAIDVIGNNIE